LSTVTILPCGPVPGCYQQRRDHLFIRLPYCTIFVHLCPVEYLLCPMRYHILATGGRDLYKVVMEVDVDKVKRLRKERVLTIRELADEAGVSKTTISNIENGQSEAYPSTIRKLARALDVTPSELVRQD
jgi:DNA-binding XRE family transcriptional regulator